MKTYSLLITFLIPHNNRTMNCITIRTPDINSNQLITLT